MYPEITPLIRDAIKRRYEIIPYLYNLMLSSHLTALPPQRWIGSGYESDPEVWSEELKAGERQYWLGDSLLVGGVYEEGVVDARVYLPKNNDEDEGYINLNAPHGYHAAGQWVTLPSEWKESIPLLVRIGSGIPVGKSVQTRSPGDDRFPSPNAVEDDYRAVEIFPPKGVSKQSYVYEWFEDDGISQKPEISKFVIKYSSTDEEVLVRFEKEGKYSPVWKELSVILPVGDKRKLLFGEGKDVAKGGEENKGRAVFQLL